MEIRALSPDDASQIAALWHEGATESGAVDSSFLPRLSISKYAELIRTALEGGDTFGWCVFSANGHSMVAYLTAEIIPANVEWKMEPYLYVLDVDVTFRARRQGHATRLLRTAISHAKAIDLQRIELSWLARDKRSAEVWRRLGFQPYYYRGFLDLDGVVTSDDRPVD